MTQSKLLPALLKHHRHARGMSQLDLASAADVSPKHLSFLETGRAKPSREMVLRLGATLALSLRDQNALLAAAGFTETFKETAVEELPPMIRGALERMLAAHEPYPLVVCDGSYNLRMLNHGASTLLKTLVPKLASATTLNVLELCFDPEGLRPYFENWEQTALFLLQRLTREHLASGRPALALLRSRLLAYPDLPSKLRDVDLAAALGPVLEVRFRLRDQRLGFLTTITAFSAPQDVTLEELRIESYYPLDDATARMCELLSGKRA